MLLLSLAACGPSTPVAAHTSIPSIEASATARPTEIASTASDQPATSSVTQRAKRTLVALDPGHGADEVGAAANGVTEKHSNLEMAFRVARILQQRDVDVLLTRETDSRAAVGSSAQSATRTDLQARVKAANAAGAAVYVSLHSNGSTNTGERGVEIYYDSRRELGEENLRLARLVLDGAVEGLTAIGSPPRNRGVLDAACWRSNNGRCVGLFVLSPASPSTQTAPAKEPTAMPAVLVELLFISSPDDAALLRDDAAREAMARGVASGILSYLGVSAPAASR